MEYRCVQCGFRIKTIFVQYSPGNIRLMKCVNCKVVADEYIECELMKPKTHRHVLFNSLKHGFALCLITWIAGSYMKFGFLISLQGLLWKSCAGCICDCCFQTTVCQLHEP
ncbi:hypothetical protein GQ457_06G030970 [Hibiscus cannabinus]